MMGSNHSRVSLATLLLGGAVLLVACDDSANTIGPENQLEVANATDQFQFQLTALDEVTDSRSYDWQSTGTSATVDVSQAVTGGSAILTIRDADGQVVYQADIADHNDGSTAEGTPGTWQIEVMLTRTTGTFNFRVQKKT